MPGYLVDSGATVMCSHGGQAQPVMTDSRVKAGGQPVVPQSSTYTVSACPYAPGGVTTPCVTAMWSTAATRVKASGVALLLADSQSQSTPNATPLTVAVTQTRVKGT